MIALCRRSDLFRASAHRSSERTRCGTEWGNRRREGWHRLSACPHSPYRRSGALPHQPEKKPRAAARDGPARHWPGGQRQAQRAAQRNSPLASDTPSSAPRRTGGAKPRAPARFSGLAGRQDRLHPDGSSGNRREADRSTAKACQQRFVVASGVKSQSRGKSSRITAIIGPAGPAREFQVPIFGEAGSQALPVQKYRT